MEGVARDLRRHWKEGKYQALVQLHDEYSSALWNGQQGGQTPGVALTVTNHAAAGFMVDTWEADQDGVVKRVIVRQYALLGAVYADTPVAKRLSRHFSATSLLPCGRCTLQGVHAWGSMHYYGYSTGTVCGKEPLLVIPLPAAGVLAP